MLPPPDLSLLGAGHLGGQAFDHVFHIHGVSVRMDALRMTRTGTSARRSAKRPLFVNAFMKPGPFNLT